MNSVMRAIAESLPLVLVCSSSWSSGVGGVGQAGRGDLVESGAGLEQGAGPEAGGPQVGARLVVASTWRASETLCTSVGPSAMPSQSVARVIGRVLVVPSAPWMCVALYAISRWISAAFTLHAAT